MKSTQRLAATAAALLALALAAAPRMLVSQAPAQRGGVPNPDTPRILVATFKSDDRKLGIEAADEVRRRLQQEHSAKELFVVSKNDVNNNLTASGYSPDSALSTTDLMELGKQVRGDEVLDGVATKSSDGSVKLETRLLIRRSGTILVQPLDVASAKNVGDAAKAVSKSLDEARKSLPSYKQCETDLRASKYDAAATDGRTGLAAYPKSTFARLCLLSAFFYGKASPDSIIKVANEILVSDPTSMLALGNLAEAYQAKGDKEKLIETNLRIYRADPTNQAILTSIIQQLAQSGAPDKALPIIDTLLINNPGDPTMLRTRWLLLLSAKDWKRAIAAGEEYVKADTAAATLEYYQRQIGAAQNANDAALIQQLASKAAQKFPKEVSLHLLLASQYSKGGQLQQALMEARRAAEVDPKNTNAQLFVITLLNQLNQPDSALAAAQKAIAAGANKDTLGQALLPTVGPALKKAQDSKSREDWQAALKAAQTVDAIAPSPQTKFYIGVSAFQIAADALTTVQADAKTNTKDSKAHGCEELKVVEDMFALASVAMPAGAKVDANTAGQIMTNLQTYGDYVPQFKKALGCK